ncbi:MAG: toprim domain-containing protein [Clostridiales bacterium]|nr:toprim domain-containing protein [Clostridiales bacterium]
MQEKDSDSINSNKNDTEFLKYSLENMRNSILNSKDRWTGFLRSSAYLYKYDFESQLSLYALSPKARADSENKDVILANLRACASKEQWQRLGANINETAKSVPILKSDGSLSYVYDVSDTDSDIKIWQPYDTPEFYSVLSKHMNTAEKDLKSMIDDRIYNFVMKTDFANGWPIGKNFQLNSIKYIVYTRCGIDIKGIDSSNMNCCSLFGGDFKSAESNILLPAKTILREIEKSVREYENIIKDRVNEQTVQPETQQVSEKTQEPTQEKQPIRQRNSRPTQRNNTRNNNNSHRRSYTNEEIQAARNTDLVDFLTRQGEQLKKVGTKEYTLPEHDSMRISGSKFYWNSQSFGGNAIDFCLKYYGMSFQEAVSRLLDYNSYSLDLQAQPVSKPKEETKPKPPVKPIPNPLDTNRNRIIEYLTKTRGISPDIVHELIVKDKLAQDIMGNAVFKIFDIEGTLTGAEIVGTQPEKRFKELTEQKGNTFIFNSSLIYPTSAIFFESAIDAISYYNLHRNETSLLVSMAGLKQQAVLNVMDRYGIKAENCLISADNDDKGRNFMKKMKDEYNINSYPITVDGRFYSYENIKDWNDLLKVEAEKNRKLRNEFIKNYFDSNEIFAPSLASDEMTSVAEEFFNYDNSWHSVSNSIADIAARYRNGENVYESSDWVKAFGSSAFTQNIMLTGDEKRANGFDFGFIEFTVETGDEGITFRYEDMEKFFSWEDFGKGQFNYIKAYFRDDIENEYNYETQPVFNNYGEEPYDLWVDASEREKSEERLERLLKRIDGKELNLNPVGKFYELYGREAQTAAEVLGLKLTEKVIGDVKTPMIGFPNFTLKDNIKKLTDLGYIYNIKEDPSVISAVEKYNPLYLKDNTDE